MAEANAARNEWVLRVLGVQLGGAARRPSVLLMPIWQQARAEIDRQVAAMQGALRSYRDENYDNIAELGFNGLTGGRNTALMAALMDYDRSPAADTGRRVATAVDAYAELLAPDSVLDDYDANPLGVAVSFRATLQHGLDALRGAVAATRSPAP